MHTVNAPVLQTILCGLGCARCVLAVCTAECRWPTLNTLCPAHQSFGLVLSACYLSVIALALLVVAVWSKLYTRFEVGTMPLKDKVRFHNRVHSAALAYASKSAKDTALASKYGSKHPWHVDWKCWYCLRTAVPACIPSLGK